MRDIERVLAQVCNCENALNECEAAQALLHGDASCLRPLHGLALAVKDTTLLRIAMVSASHTLKQVE